MPGPIRNFLIGLRVGFNAKGVIADVDNLTPTQGAHLALILALIRSKMFEEQVPGSNVTIGDIVQRPIAYRKELGLAAFTHLELLRQTSRDNVKSYESFGVSPNPAIMEHIEICDLALSILMSTVGVAFMPSTLETVRYSWKQVTSHIPTEEDIALVLLMPEYITNDAMEPPLEPAQWLELGRNVPDFLRPII